MLEKRNLIADYMSRALFVFLFFVCLNAFSNISVNRQKEDSKKATITQAIESAGLVEASPLLYQFTFLSNAHVPFIDTFNYSIIFDCKLPQFVYANESNAFIRFFYHHHSAYSDEHDC